MAISDLMGKLQGFMQAQKDATQTAKQDPIDSITQQILNQWKQLGATSIPGGISIEDRARGLAERLYANQITDLSKIGMGYGTAPSAQNMINMITGMNKLGNTIFKITPSEEAAARLQETVNKLSNKTPYLTYDGRQIGFLGDIGTAENWRPSGFLQPGGLASWGAQGEGAVSYTAKQAPNGQVYFVPSWGSTSDIGTVAPLLSLASIIPSPIQPFAAAANAAVAIDQGNVLGGLASLAGIPGVSNAAQAAGLGSVVTGLQTANQAVNLGKALESGNLLGALASGANLTGTGGVQLGDTGVSVADALKTANIAKALESGNVAPLIGALASSGAVSGPKASDFESGYFEPGGAGYYDKAVEQSIAPTTTPLGTTPSNQDILDAIGYTPAPVQPTEPILTLPTEITVPKQEQQAPSIETLIKELEPYRAPAAPTPASLELPKTDYSFKADYTLFPEPTQPSLEDMGGAQGVKAPELPDVFTQEGAVDYGLVGPSLYGGEPGLTMPKTPNLDSMGGGQGITTPVDGGTMTGAGLIPEGYVAPLGDLESFINKPVPGADVSGAVEKAINAAGATPPKGETVKPGAAPTAKRLTAAQQPAAQAGGIDVLSLLALMGATGGEQQAAQQPTQPALADVKSFEELGYGDIFGPKLQFADGGSVGDLIAILRG